MINKDDRLGLKNAIGALFFIPFFLGYAFILALKGEKVSVK